MVSRSALDVRPWDWEEWLEAALLARELGHHDEAIELAGVALALAPSNPGCHTFIRDVLRQQGSQQSLPWADAFDTVATRLQEVGRDDLAAAGEVGPVAFVGRWTQALSDRDPQTLAELAAALRPYSTLVANHIGSLQPDPELALQWYGTAISWFDGSAASKLDGFDRAPVEWFLDLANACVDVETRLQDAFDHYKIVLGPQPGPLAVTLDDKTILLRPEAAEPNLRARALAGRARASLYQGNIRAALDDCDEAIQIDPCLAAPYQTQAEIFSRRGQHEQAAARWQLVAQLAPELSAFADAGIADAQRVRALAERDETRRAELFGTAAAAYRRALRGDEQSVRRPRALAFLGRCLAELGQVEQAVPHLEEAAFVAGDNAQYLDVLYELGRAYEISQQFVLAEDCYRRAREIAVTELGDEGTGSRLARLTSASGACDALASFLVDQEIRLDEAKQVAVQAVAYSQEAFELDPGHREQLAVVRATLGWLRYKHGHNTTAIRELQTAVELSPLTQHRRRLAIVLEASADGRNGDRRAELLRTAARGQWERIRELDPSFAELADEHLSEPLG